METIEISYSTIDSLLEKIKSDIYRFKELGIYDERINISIPTFTKNILEKYLLDNNLSRLMDSVDIFFGCNVVPGYNNQICVFDNMATPDSFAAEPIIVKFSKK